VADTFCPCLGDADRVRLRESVNSPLEKAGENPCFRQRTNFPTPANPFYAGVQAMRARICSALSCDMFARVVYVRLWGVQNCRLLLCHLPARTRHAWLARLTRARGRRFLRGWKILLNDFCRAFGHSKARQTQSFFKYLHQKTHEIRKRISCVFYFTFSAYHHQ